MKFNKANLFKEVILIAERFRGREFTEKEIIEAFAICEELDRRETYEQHRESGSLEVGQDKAKIH